MFGFEFSIIQKKKWSQERSGINNAMFGQRGVQSPGYKHGLYCQGKKCQDCGKLLAIGLHSRCQSCAKKEYYKHCDISGEKNPNWKGGRSTLNLLIYNSPEYKSWRTKIFQRDCYSCQICGKNGGLNAHHKIPLVSIIELYQLTSVSLAKHCKLLWDLTWGITLCPTCHKKIKS
jgi:5-methylcytosine-specific restriction endonuclease McrA